MRTRVAATAVSITLLLPVPLMAQPVREHAHEASERAKEHVQAAKAHAQAAKEKAREGMREAREDARKAIQEAREAGHAVHMEAKEAVKEAREEAREAIKEAHEEVRDALKAAHADAHGLMKHAHDQAHKLVQDAEAALKTPPTVPEQEDRRGKARKAHWQRLRAEHPQVAERPEQIPPDVRSELKLHARRMARLARAQAVAAEAKDEKARGRAQALMQKEIARHRQQLMASWNQRDKQPAEAEAAKTPDEHASDVAKEATKKEAAQ